ncbi:MAG: hypothetical protein LBK29_04530 [Oscillospiraceae bacterium]|nr:hypothetical protein [Oscillospiraceae bacterium]
MKKQFKKFLSIFLLSAVFLPLKSKAEEETVKNPNFELKDRSKQSSNLLRALRWIGVPAASVGVLGFLFKDKIFEFLNKREYLPVVDFSKPVVDFSELERKISEAKILIETEVKKMSDTERPTFIIDLCATKKPSNEELESIVNKSKDLFNGEAWSLELIFGNSGLVCYNVESHPIPTKVNVNEGEIFIDCSINFDSSDKNRGKMKEYCGKVVDIKKYLKYDRVFWKLKFAA